MVSTKTSVKNLKNDLKKSKPTSKYGNPLYSIAKVLTGSNDGYDKLKNDIKKNKSIFGEVKIHHGKNHDYIILSDPQLFILLGIESRHGHSKMAKLVNKQSAYIMARIRDYIRAMNAFN